MEAPKRRTKCFFNIGIDGELKGQIVCELYDDIVPKTCKNFLELCRGTNELGPTTGKIMTYRGCTVHRVTNGRLIETGDFSHNDGSGGESIYGGTFEDENFDALHENLTLTMINKGPHTNGSVFAFVVNASYDLEGKNVAFGKILRGKYLLENIIKIPVDKEFKPVADIVIMDCGVLHSNKEEGELTTSSSNSVFEEEVERRRKSPSIEVVGEIKKTRRLQASDIPRFRERENPLYRSSPDENNHKRRRQDERSPYNEVTSRKRGFEEHDDRQRRFDDNENKQRSRHRGDDYENREHRRNFGRRRYRESPPGNDNNDRQKIKGRGAKSARYMPYAKEDIPTPSYWKTEMQRIIPMRDAQQLLSRKREETRLQFESTTNEAEKKNLFPIYNPKHDEIRKMAQKKAEEEEKAEKEIERYFGYLNTSDLSTPGPSTSTSQFYHSSNLEQSYNTTRNSTSSGFYPPGMFNAESNGERSNNNMFVRSAPPQSTSSSNGSNMQSIPPQRNDIVNGVRNICIQSPSIPPLPPPPPHYFQQQQPQSSVHLPRPAYPPPRQFFF